MKRVIWFAVLIALATLAGCSSEEPEGPETIPVSSGEDPYQTATFAGARAEWEQLAELGDPEAWSSDFHVWRMDWDDKVIKLYVDGRLLNQVDLTKTYNKDLEAANPFHDPHYLILNLAIGGDFGGDPSQTAFPTEYVIDWVRVYQITGD